jgi:hypothetical protein
LGSINGGTADSLIVAYPTLSWLIDFLFSLTIISLVMFLLLFPNGHFVPVWLRVPAGVWSVGLLLSLLTPQLSKEEDSFPE